MLALRVYRDSSYLWALVSPNVPATPTSWARIALVSPSQPVTPPARLAEAASTPTVSNAAPLPLYEKSTPIYAFLSAEAAISC